MRRNHTIALAALLAILSSDAADARRRVYYRIRTPAPAAAPAPEIKAVKTIRVIPTVRWRLWCERIGGSDC